MGGDWGGGSSCGGREITHLVGSHSCCLERQGQAQGQRVFKEVLPLGHHSTAPLCLSGGSGFLHKHPICRAPPSLPSPQDVSSRPTTVLCLGLLSKPQVPVPSPCLQWRTPSQAGWAGQGSYLRTVLTLSCPLVTVFSSQRERGPPSVPTELPPGRGFPRYGDLSSLQIRPGFCRSHPASFPLPFRPSVSCPTWLSRNLSCPLRCPSSSARVPQGSVRIFPLQDVFLMLL